MALITCRPVLKLLDSVCRQILKLADIFLIFLTLSASKLWDRQTFASFLLFCLPTQFVAGRQTPDFLAFVCHQIVRLADICFFSLVLSADFIGGWQTFSGFPCFCLPPNCGTGRHLLLFSCFVCRLHLWLADIIQISLLLSATKLWDWQTFASFLLFCLPT